MNLRGRQGSNGCLHVDCCGSQLLKLVVGSSAFLEERFLQSVKPTVRCGHESLHLLRQSVRRVCDDLDCGLDVLIRIVQMTESVREQLLVSHAARGSRGQSHRDECMR